MCDAPNREAAMVVLDRDASGKPTVWCDPCIAPIVRALNAGGVRTVASCCGHGSQPGNVALATGQELLILPDFESARRYSASWARDEGGTAENDAPEIERIDRYTITVNGHRIRATEGQEHALRAMDAAGVRRFLTVMGCPIPPGSTALPDEDTGEGT